MHNTGNKITDRTGSTLSSKGNIESFMSERNLKLLSLHTESPHFPSLIVPHIYMFYTAGLSLIYNRCSTGKLTVFYGIDRFINTKRHPVPPKFILILSSYIGQCPCDTNGLFLPYFQNKILCEALIFSMPYNIKHET
jgi:hypothetical protein